MYLGFKLYMYVVVVKFLIKKSYTYMYQYLDLKDGAVQYMYLW